MNTADRNLRQSHTAEAPPAVVRRRRLGCHRPVCSPRSSRDCLDACAAECALSQLSFADRGKESQRYASTPRYSYRTLLCILSNLSLDLYGLTVHGADPYPNPPLLQVHHAEVGVRIVSVLHRKWYLDSFVVDRPVVKVFTDAHGVTNIPVIKSSGSSSSNTSVFDLGIRHAVLDQGAVFYNNRESALSADLHNVDFRASFDSLLQKYSGRLSLLGRATPVGWVQADSAQPGSRVRCDAHYLPLDPSQLDQRYIAASLERHVAGL